MAFKRYILFAILVQFHHSKCFECPGYSIPRKFRCDAVNNCGDNSDEEGCPTSNAGKYFSDYFLKKVYTVHWED